MTSLMIRIAGLIVLIGAALGTVPPGSAPSAFAADFTVNSTADEVDADPNDDACLTANDECTLRAAIQQANVAAGNDTITLPAGTYLLDIDPNGAGEDDAKKGDLDIKYPLEIIGEGAAVTIIDGAGYDRVFDIGFNDPTVTISGVTIQKGDGDASFGGGIYLSGATLMLSDSILSDNKADGSGGGGIAIVGGHAELTNVTVSGNSGANGGGIYHPGGGATSTLTNVTVSGNKAGGTGGGINSQNMVTVTNSTISGNEAGADGGGIAITFGQAELTNVTVSGNSGGNGGGIYIFDKATVKNSIVANNTGDNCAGPSDITSAGHNLDDDNTCGFNDPTDLPNTDPKLAALADNGGATQTHALQAGSPAIDAGDDAACPDTDQRGAARPKDGDGDGNAVCDIGAYEAEPPAPTPTPGGGGGGGGGGTDDTATPTPTPTPAPSGDETSDSSDDDGGVPAWLVTLIVALGAAAATAGGFWFFALRRRRGSQENEGGSQ